MPVEKFPVEAGHIMMFARAVGDDNRIYYDENYAAESEVQKIVAPPTFVQSSAQFDPEYQLRPKIGQEWYGSAKSASGLTTEEEPKGDGRLHAEQHFEYHRHLNPGDVLNASVKPGKTWEKQGKRGGKLMFEETITEYRDPHGNLVITAKSVGVTTERPADSA